MLVGTVLVKTALVETAYQIQWHPCTLDRDTRIFWFQTMIAKTMLVETMLVENRVS